MMTMNTVRMSRHSWIGNLEQEYVYTSEREPTVVPDGYIAIHTPGFSWVARLFSHAYCDRKATTAFAEAYSATTTPHCRALLGTPPGKEGRIGGQ